MSTLPSTSLHKHFAQLTDPRATPAKRHELLDIIAIALCAVICGADTWVDVERFGRAKEAWLRSFLSLSNGIPSHDTFGRVFAALDPAQFEQAFSSWVQEVVVVTNGEVIAIDGKTARRSHDRSHGQSAVHMVSAWATTNHLVLGQLAVAEKSNEITAIPALLEVLMLQNRIVTIDAMGCQTAIAAMIRARGGDYVLALKGNQGTLQELVTLHFAALPALAAAGPAIVRTVEKHHGRMETRTCVVDDDPAILAWLDPTGAWSGLRSLAMVRAERRIGETVSTETRYYLSSLPGDAAQLAHAVRAHWGIENQLHWVLDMAFREDESRVRTGDAAENLAVLRHIALNLLRQETSVKVGIKAKRLMCGWDQRYLLKVLST